MALRLKHTNDLDLSEHEIQKAFFNYVDRQIALGKEEYEYIYSTKNEGKRSYKVAAMYRATGMRRGVLDVSVDYPVAVGGALWCPGLRIEFKAKKNKMSDDQQLWACRLLKAGFCVAVAYTAESAIAATRLYFAGELPAGNLHILGR